jgi:chromosome segregation ATPase
MTTIAQTVAYETTIANLRRRLADLEKDLKDAREDLERNAVQTNEFSNKLDDEKELHLKTQAELASAKVRITELAGLVQAADARALKAASELAAYHHDRKTSYHTLDSLPPQATGK